MPHLSSSAKNRAPATADSLPAKPVATKPGPQPSVQARRYHRWDASTLEEIPARHGLGVLPLFF